MAARRQKNMMTRSYRVFLNDVNHGKQKVLTDFLYRCHDVMQYFVDLFWQRQEFGGKLADLPTVHRAVHRFGITTRLGQALAKQASEIVASQRKKDKKRKPNMKRHVVTLFYHFIAVEPFKGKGFDFCVSFDGSGAPKGLTIPIPSNKPLNKKLQDGWTIKQTIRLGLRDGRLFFDLIVEKERPQPKREGRVVGMDSNYKNGLVFSDGQTTGTPVYERIQGFAKRQKHTRAEVKSLLGAAIKQIDFSQIKVLVIEDLKKVKSGTRGTFSRRFNRRLSHWIYGYSRELLTRHCEALGIEVIAKNPWKTSQFCRKCFKWDRRNRSGDKFLCVNCHHVDHADDNASKNLELLGLLGFYGIHDLISSKCQSFE